MHHSLRPMTPDDVEVAVRLTAAEGWATHASWFRAILAHDPDGSFVAVAKRRVVGIVTSVRYARTAWIGNLVVEPERRRHGLGTRLVRHLVGELEASGVATTRLEADPLGIKLYRRFGFEDELESLRFALDGEADDPGDGAVDEATRLGPGDLSAVGAFDRRFFGDDRERMLALLHDAAVGSWAVRREGEIAGYGMLLPSEEGLRFGPWVAADAAAAEAVLAAALRERRGAAVTVGVPETTPRAAELLAAHGFAPTDSSFRLRRGPDDEPPVAGHVFAIAHGAIG